MSLTLIPTSETLLETPSGSALEETPCKALLTVTPPAQLFIYCSSILQYTEATGSSQVNQYPFSDINTWAGPKWIAGLGDVYFPGQPTSWDGPGYSPYENYPYVVQFEASVLFADQLVPHGELEILEADTPYYVYLLWPGMTLSSIGWMFRSLDDLQPTQWLLGNSPEEDNPGAVGYGYQFEYIGNPPSGPPYTEFFEGNGGEQFYSGFAVFPSRNYIVGGFSPQFPSPDPDPGNADPGTTIILFKAGIKGCIALHAYDSTRTVLQPADPDDVQQVNLTQDGPNYFNGPVSEIDTGMALLFWIGLTPDQLPTEPFNPTALGLLTVQ